MGPVILKMLPFALGTIAPTMIGLVVIFLTGTRGLVKTSAFILGKYLFYVFWGLVCLDLVDHLSSPGLKVSRSVSESFFLIAGLLLLILAVRNFFVEDDPDTPPPKFMTVLAKLGPIKLFGLGIGKSMRMWLVHNQRMINVVVMGIFGILLLFLGLTGIY